MFQDTGMLRVAWTMTMTITITMTYERQATNDEGDFIRASLVYLLYFWCLLLFTLHNLHYGPHLGTRA